MHFKNHLSFLLILSVSAFIFSQSSDTVSNSVLSSPEYDGYEVLEMDDPPRSTIHSEQSTMPMEEVIPPLQEAEMQPAERSSFQSSAYEDQEYTVPELKDKLASFTTMTNAGMGLLVPGIISIPLGIVLFVSGLHDLASPVPDDEYSWDTETDSGSRKLFTGWVFIGVGIPLTIAGSVLTSIGSKKQKEYRYRYENASNQLSLIYTGTGLQLVYSF